VVNGWARDYDSLTQPIFFPIHLLQTRVNAASEGNMSDFKGNMSDFKGNMSDFKGNMSDLG